MEFLFRLFNVLFFYGMSIFLILFHHLFRRFHTITAKNDRRLLSTPEDEKSLFSAATNGDIWGLEKALAKGINVNSKDEKGNTPLMLATINGHLSAVIILVHCGANINLSNKYGLTPIMLAVCRGRYKILHYLLNKGANIFLRAMSGYTVLQWTIAHNRLDMLKLLVIYGAKLNEHYARGNTPLLTAVVAGRFSIVHWLLHNGSKLDELNDEGESSLSLAKKFKRGAIKDYLSTELKKGKRIQSRKSKIKSIIRLRLKLAELQREENLSFIVKSSSTLCSNAITENSNKISLINESQKNDASSTSKNSSPKPSDSRANVAIISAHTPAQLESEQNSKKRVDTSDYNNNIVNRRKKNSAYTFFYKKIPHFYTSVTIILPAYVRDIMHRLTQHGYHVYLVGGCIRDFLLGRNIADYDMITNASLSAVIEVVGIGMTSQHIDNLYKIFIQDISIDIICDEKFTLTTDPYQRDFTCNTLYADKRGRVIDVLKCGISDIENRKLVVIGDAEERFKEDPLRLLRLSRLVASYNFTVDDDLFVTVRSLAPLIQGCSGGRLQYELRKHFLRGCAVKSFKELKKLELLKFSFPEISAFLDLFQYENWLLGKLAQTDKLVALKYPVSIHYIYAMFRMGSFIASTNAEETSEQKNSVYDYFKKVGRVTTKLIKEHDELSSFAPSAHV